LFTRYAKRWNPEKLNDPEYKAREDNFLKLQLNARVEVSEAKVLDLLTAEDMAPVEVKSALHQVRHQMSTQGTDENLLLPEIIAEMKKVLGTPF
jgi:hypothetical protein